jgi:hypothetical protein
MTVADANVWNDVKISHLQTYASSHRARDNVSKGVKNAK